MYWCQLLSVCMTIMYSIMINQNVIKFTSDHCDATKLYSMKYRRTNYVALKQSAWNWLCLFKAAESIYIVMNVVLSIIPYMYYKTYEFCMHNERCVLWQKPANITKKLKPIKKIDVITYQMLLNKSNIQQCKNIHIYLKHSHVLTDLMNIT